MFRVQIRGMKQIQKVNPIKIYAFFKAAYLCCVNATIVFDLWALVFCIAAIQGYFLAFILFRWRRGPVLANRLLAVLLFLYAYTLSEYVLYWTHLIYYHPHFANSSAQFPFLFGPLLFGYCRNIYEPHALRRQDAWHLLPFVIATAVMLPWYSLDFEVKQAVLQGKGVFPGPKKFLSVLIWLRIGHLFAYAGYLLWYLRRQPAAGVTNAWARRLVLFFTGFALAYASYFVLVRFSFFNLAWDYHISAAMTAFIYLIAYSGYVRPAVFDGYQWTEPGESRLKYRNSGLTPEAARSLLHRLDTLMRTEHLYRDATLSLETLAEKLQVGKHHLSQVINEHLSANFFEYINALRIEEAKTLLRESNRSELHIIEAAYTVGFNNKVSFNNAFKKATGLTPTAYRKQFAESGQDT